MAEFVLEPLLSSLFQTLFDKLASRDLRSFFQGLKVNEGLLRKLKMALWSAYQLLDDAEVKRFTNPNVRKWLLELKEAIYEAEDVLDEINYRALRFEHRRSKPLSKRFQSFLNCFSTFGEAIERKIEEILAWLKSIVEQKDVLGLQQGVTSRLSQRLPAPLPDERYVYGRNDDKEKIMELLLSDNGSNSNKISVIPITGMGGVGKTTLAHLVCEEDKVKCQFPIRSWVTVSDDSTLSVIAKRIIFKVTSKECTIDDPVELQLALKKALSDKKFLLVLDDVWDASYAQLEPLMNCFQSGAHGSRIIVTARSDTIATKMKRTWLMGIVSTYHLQTVSDDACWNLFEKYAFEDARSETCQELRAIGRDIVKKCNGLPLAVKSLATVLRSVSDPKEWKQLLSSDIWELQLQGNEGNEILPSLWLSYHYLPPHLKRCFAYCSMFPKDYEMNELRKKEVILLWMAEGLVLPEIGGKQLEDIGNDYFRDLISRSLFQPLSKDKSTTLMHDLMHDLAVFVSGEFSFRLDDKSKAKFSSKTRHLSYSKIDEFENFESLSEAKCIRSCLRLSSSYGGSSSIVRQLDVLLSVGGCLRALCLSGCSFAVLPDSIGNLKHLRYLDLSGNNNIEEIPNMLCSLYNLQTLKLSWCRKLTQLPTEMGNLINLRHLDIRGVPLEKMPTKMCNLKDLQTLSNFVLGEKGGSRIKDLGGLHYLSGALEFSKLQNADVVGDVCEAKLKDKEHLSELVFCWSSDHDSRKDREVLDALEPHSNLKGLVIDGYGAATFSNWLGHCSYANIITVTLKNCNNCCLLPSLGQLPSLQDLAICSCNGVERIGAEFYYYGGSSNIQPFRSLKSLYFEVMLEWQEWSFCEGHEDGGCFPKLEDLYIADCPKLSTCVWSPGYFPSLKTLKIHDSEHIAVLPEIQQMETAFPSLDLLYINNCTIPETFLLSNLPASLKELHLFGYDFDFYYPKTIFPPCFTIGRYKNVTMFPEALLPTTLTCLRIHSLRNLKGLNGEGFQHLTSLMVLEISGCESLESLSENALPVSLISLSISWLPSLEDVGTGFFQHLVSLEQLEIKNCKNLQCSGNGNGGIQHLISLKMLTIQDCEKLQSLLEEGLPTSLTFLHIEGFPNLRELNRMGFRHLNSLIELEIGDCKNLQCLPAEGLPSSLSSLYIYACPLLVPRCQKGTGEDWHKISHILHVKIEPNQRNYFEESFSSFMSILSG